MIELDVFDKEKGKLSTVDLSVLTNLIKRYDSKLLSGKWDVLPGAFGYGVVVQDISEKGYKNIVTIDGDYLFSVLDPEKEFFDMCSIRKMDGNLEVGVGDGSYIYIKSNDEKLIEYLSEFFKIIRITRYIDIEN